MHTIEEQVERCKKEIERCVLCQKDPEELDRIGAMRGELDWRITLYELTNCIEFAV